MSVSRADWGPLCCADALVRKGGEVRTTFRMSMEVQQLQATLNYETKSAATLALASIEDVGFDLAIHPSTMGLSATLGNLRAQDGTLALVRCPALPPSPPLLPCRL